MGPAARPPSPATSRERLKQDFTRAAKLRELFPQVAEVRIEFEFDDGSSLRPSPQSYAYFPAARGFFRYACPCHACSGEFDLSAAVAELAAKLERTQRSRQLRVTCTGQRAAEAQARVACPVCAQIRLSAVPLPPD